MVTSLAAHIREGAQSASGDEPLSLMQPLDAREIPAAECRATDSDASRSLAQRDGYPSGRFMRLRIS